MRKIIFDLLNSLYPTYGIGQHENDCLSPYLVLKFDNQNSSISGGLGGWQVFQVMVYIPDSSILLMDVILEEVKNKLVADFIEPTNNITPDFRDTMIKAYMRSMEFKIPKGL